MREGRERHFADITVEVDPGDEEETVVEDYVTVRLKRPDSRPEPESDAPTTYNAAFGSKRSETHAKLEIDIATSLEPDMEIESSDRRIRLRE